jgi:hypothetical protein
MHPSIRTLAGLAGGLALLTVACNRGEDSQTTAPIQKSSDKTPAQSQEVKPVTSLDLGKGHSLEFYDFGNNALISESGIAGDKHLFNPGNTFADLQAAASDQGDVIARVWKFASPAAPMPKALADLRARMAKLPVGKANPVSLPHEASGEPMTNLVQDQSLAKTASPVGCNNGCCDKAWTDTHCDYGGDYDWNLYNYGWSWVNGGANLYNGFVCASVGTSTYKVNVGGRGGAWSVTQGTYRTYFWSAGFPYFNSNMTSSVNSQSSPHLHTYCGTLWN